MHDIWTLVLGAVGAACAWFALEFIGRPFLRFRELRREANRCLVEYGNVSARDGSAAVQARMLGYILPGTKRTGPDRLSEAQDAFRNLAAEMRAFANSEYLATGLVKLLRYDPNKSASALLGFSNEIAGQGPERAAFRAQIEQLLRIKTTE